MAKPKNIKRVGTGNSSFLNLMVYGEPGTGKTVLAGTSPKCLILECDRGTDSAAIAGSTADQWPIEDWDDMHEAFEYLAQGGGTEEYEWVWIDSITAFQERGLDSIMAELVAAKPHRKLYLPDKGEYGQNMNRVSLLLRDLRDLPINVGVTAHVLRTEDFEDGETRYMPAVQGRGMPEKICGYMGIVGRTEAFTKDGKDQVRFTTRKGDDGKFYTKDRYGIGSLLNPTIPKITKIVEAARSGQPLEARPRTRKSSTAQKGQ